MPEAPDLEVIKDFLNQRVKGAVVSSARVLRPTVLRSLMGDFTVDVAGREVGEFRRSGKFLLMELSEDRLLVVNPMLTGAFQLCKPSSTIYKRTCFIPSLSNDQELRYLDDRQMGKVYYPELPDWREAGWRTRSFLVPDTRIAPAWQKQRHPGTATAVLSSGILSPPAQGVPASHRHYARFRVVASLLRNPQTG